MNDILKEYQGKRILITGGAGCIGSNLTLGLLRCEPKKITVLDDLSSSSRWNIPDDPRVEFVLGSILDEVILKRVFFEGPEYVFHLAALFANQNSIDHPERDLLVNGLGTLKVLQYSKLSGAKRFIFASAGCSIYGVDPPLPLKETDPVSLNLETPYQITKLLGELYCNFFQDFYELPTVRIRFFNVYGPREIPGRYRNVITNFIYYALHNRPLPITGTGEETRDYIYVEDVVDGIMRGGIIGEAIGEAFNLGSGTEMRITEIADLINGLLDNKNGIIFVDRRDWDRITRRRASTEKAKNLLGFEAKTGIEVGIRNTIDWFMENSEKIERDARF
jgi:nucleoside-diphosphate-sugar epimerase